jgi:hypothetical protein
MRQRRGNLCGHPRRWRGLCAGATGLLFAGCVLGSAGTADRPGEVRLVGYGAAGGPPRTGAGPMVRHEAGDRKTGAFSIAGSVRGLYPGEALPLVLTVTNPWPYAIVVTTVTTDVGGAHPGCGAANLSVEAFSGQLHVSAKGSGRTVVDARMRKAAPDACQGAVFPLSYSGSAFRP